MKPPNRAAPAILWFGLAVVALALSGALAVVLVVGRVPGLAPALIHDVDFARRSLVVHVNLAVGVWFFAFISGLFCLLPGAPRGRAASLPMVLSTSGVVAFTIPICLRAASPVLSNYVPVLDHWLFVLGLGLFASGVSVTFIDGRLLPEAGARSEIPPEARWGIRVAALAFLVAMTTIAVAYLTRDPRAEPLPGFERLFWGGGHVLQTAAAMAMLAVWLILLGRLTGRPAMSPRFATVLFVAMLIPTLLAPVLTRSASPHPLFTTLMQFGIAPAVVVVMWRGGASLLRCRGPLHARLGSPALSGLVTSCLMTLIGFVLGAAITVNTTLTPAHYHMSIGAVTVSFMALLMTLLPTFGAPLRQPRLATWQPVVYGVGQTLFATGLGIAGFWGHAARKVYGREQQLGTSALHGGLVVAGIGGLLAMVGGVLFFFVIIRAWTQRRRGDLETNGRVRRDGQASSVRRTFSG